MIRTVISLHSKDKDWLDKKAKEEGHTMTYVVREAIQEYRAKVEKKHPSMDELLKKTAGTWKKGDGLAYQRKSRKEWR